MICSASSRRRLSMYPATEIDTGSPSGAICSTDTISPGRQPISMSFKCNSWLPKLLITAFWPSLNSDSFLFIILNYSKSNIVFISLFTNFEIMPSQTKSNIYFFFPAAVTLRDRTRLKEFILSIFKREKTKLASLNYIFCDDRQLLAINKQYLAHDFYTDIISFELSQPGQPVEGEIYISTDRVKDNAISLGETFKRELHRVIFHGALHLCGYRDKTKAEIEKMRAEENYYLDKYFKGKI